MELGQVAFVFPLLDGRWCNCGVKQSASDRPPSNSLRAQAQHLPGTAIGAKVCRTWGFGAADLALRRSVCTHDQRPVRAGRKPHSALWEGKGGNVATGRCDDGSTESWSDDAAPNQHPSPGPRQPHRRRTRPQQGTAREFRKCLRRRMLPLTTNPGRRGPTAVLTAVLRRLDGGSW